MFHFLLHNFHQYIDILTLDIHTYNDGIFLPSQRIENKDLYNLHNLQK